ncbi:MAG: OsmC family protein [Gemmatimonadaceae bacterium]
MDIKQNPNERHEYSASIVWTGARSGPTTSYQSYSREYEYRIGTKPAMRGSADPAFRGDGMLYNPEEMLVVALSTCHLLSYLAGCSRAGLRVVSYEDSASGLMLVKDGKVRFTEVVLRPRVAVEQGTNLEKAHALHAQAHEECYIASSVNFPVRHEATVVVAS